MKERADGFREGRSCADAVACAFNALSNPNSAPWVPEGDIQGCYDNIAFGWMFENIPMDKVVLQKWLRAGYLENGIHFPTRKGVPQGGIVSPTLANMVLDGLEEAVRCAVPRRSRIDFDRYIDKISDKSWSAIITYRNQKVRIISVRRARKEEIEIYES